MSTICKTLELTGLRRDDYRLLESARTRCGIIANDYVTRWHNWHREHRSREQLEEWLAALRDWRRAEKGARGEKPKCPVRFVPDELKPELASLPWAHAKTNSRVVTLVMQWLRGKLTTSHAGMSEWIEVLLNRRRSPQFLHGLPVPIDRQNAKVYVGEFPDGAPQLRIEFRVDRIDTGKKKAVSTRLDFGLKATGKKQAYAQPIWDAADSGGEIRGAKLVYKQSCRKWFVAFSLDPPAVARKPLDPNKTAIVCPGWTVPFLIRVDGRSLRHGYTADHVGHTRTQIARQRRGRQNYYRLGCSGSRKSHGRDRALQPWEMKLSLKWRSFTKRCNDGWSHDLAERLVKMRVGRVVLIQPTDGRRFLETTGRQESDTSSGWDWTQWKALASRKLGREGIEVVEMKDSVGRRSAQRFVTEDVA